MRIPVCFVVTFAVAFIQPLMAEQKIFRAGAATSNITPFLGTDLIGGFNPRGSLQIHDELHARCLVLDDGTTKSAIVIVDNVKFPNEVHMPTKRKIAETTGIAPEYVLIAATHTHSAPSLRGKSYLELDEPLDDYQKFVIRRVTDGVQRAINNLAPAHIGWGIGKLPQHVFNRRWLLKDGQKVTSPYGDEELAAMNPGRYIKVLERPAGPVNPEVYVLSVKTPGGEPIALLANYWLHYVGGTGQGHVSADYFGVFAEKIKSILATPGQDPPFVGMLSNGASGDINNNDYASYTNPGRKKYQRYEKMAEVAGDLAAEVARVEKEINYHDWVKLGAAAQTVTVKRRKPTVGQVEAAKALLENSGPEDLQDRDFAKRATFARRAIEAADWPDTADAFVQTLKIGELGIAALPYEVFVEVGFAIQKDSPFADTFFIGLANGGLGYLPSPEQHRLGGYETWLTVAHTEVDASEKLSKVIRELFGKLHSSE